MKYYIVDAFADRVFHGNQAGVCLPDAPLDEKTMQSIAAENNLSETAFVTRNGDGFDLRWFTPTAEVDLCGHATLASAYVLWRYVDKGIDVMRFNTRSGVLTVEKRGGLFEMDFPSRPPESAELPPLMERALGAAVLETYLSRDFLLLVQDEETVRNLAPDMGLLAQIEGCLGIIVTARGENVDFVSRFFAPSVGVPEDPVTGSAHSTLIPFWAERLGKQKMTALQLSKRGGTLYCEARGERVAISGAAAMYLEGEIHI